jgi:ferric-dicitrate binding protein FerR (iron transport regulator)
MRKQFITITSVLVLSFAFATASFAAEKSCRVTIVGINAPVEVQLKGKDAWKAAQLNQCLKIGDKLRTGKNGKAALNYDDEDTQVRVNAMSMITINTQDPDSDDPSQTELHTGEAWAKVAKQGRKFTIKTPTAIAGVRGTEFDVAVDEEGQSTVHVLDGVVSVLNDLGEVLAEAGQMTQVLRDVIPGAPEAFDVDAFKSKIDEWKDKINIGKLIEEQTDAIQDKVQDKVPVKIPKLKF